MLSRLHVNGYQVRKTGKPKNFHTGNYHINMRKAISTDLHLIYAEHVKDFRREKDGSVRENILAAMRL